MENSSPAEQNGIARRKDGRFGVGNKFGRGNPLNAKVARFRATLLKSVKTEDVEEVVQQLIRQARGGDIMAIREFLLRALGKPDLDESTVLDIIIHDNPQAIIKRMVESGIQPDQIESWAEEAAGRGTLSPTDLADLAAGLAELARRGEPATMQTVKMETQFARERRIYEEKKNETIRGGLRVTEHVPEGTGAHQRGEDSPGQGSQA